MSYALLPKVVFSLLYIFAPWSWYKLYRAQHNKITLFRLSVTVRINTKGKIQPVTESFWLKPYSVREVQGAMYSKEKTTFGSKAYYTYYSCIDIYTFMLQVV